MNAPGPTKVALFVTYAALMILLAISAAGASLPLGSIGKLCLALGVASAKTTLVFVFFMQLRYQRGLVRIFSLAGFCWLALIATFLLADYYTRGWET